MNPSIHTTLIKHIMDHRHHISKNTLKLTVWEKRKTSPKIQKLFFYFYCTRKFIVTCFQESAISQTIEVRWRQEKQITIASIDLILMIILPFLFLHIFLSLLLVNLIFFSCLQLETFTNEFIFKRISLNSFDWVFI